MSEAKPDAPKKFVSDLETRPWRKALAFALFYKDPFQKLDQVNERLLAEFGKILDNSDDLRPLRNLALTLHGYEPVGPAFDCKNISNKRARIRRRPQLKLDGLENYAAPSERTKQQQPQYADDTEGKLQQIADVARSMPELYRLVVDNADGKHRLRYALREVEVRISELRELEPTKNAD